MNKAELENLTYQLNRRLILLEELTTAIATAGIIFRQIAGIDSKLSRSFKSLITFPAEFTPAGFRAAVEKELDLQLTEGDPDRDSFRAAVEPPRADLAEQMKTIHESLLRDISEGKGA